MTESLHVIPVGDLIEHTTTVRCPCLPTAETAPGGSIYVHHAADRRETREHPTHDYVHDLACCSCGRLGIDHGPGETTSNWLDTGKGKWGQ